MMPENSPSTRIEGLSPDQQADLDRLVQEAPTLEYMIQNGPLPTWAAYADLNWTGRDPGELDEIETQVKELLQEIEK